MVLPRFYRVSENIQTALHFVFRLQEAGLIHGLCGVIDSGLRADEGLHRSWGLRGIGF